MLTPPKHDKNDSLAVVEKVKKQLDLHHRTQELASAISETVGNREEHGGKLIGS